MKFIFLLSIPISVTLSITSSANQSNDHSLVDEKINEFAKSKSCKYALGWKVTKEISSKMTEIPYMGAACFKNIQNSCKLGFVISPGDPMKSFNDSERKNIRRPVSTVSEQGCTKENIRKALSSELKTFKDDAPEGVTLADFLSEFGNGYQQFVIYDELGVGELRPTPPENTKNEDGLWMWEQSENKCKPVLIDDKQVSNLSILMNELSNCKAFHWQEDVYLVHCKKQKYSFLVGNGANKCKDFPLIIRKMSGKQR